MEYMVKRRLYKGRGEYSEVGETVEMAEHEATALTESGSIEPVAQDKAKAKAKSRKNPD